MCILTKKKEQPKDYGNIFLSFCVLIKCFYFIMIIMFITVAFSAKKASMRPGVAPNTGQEFFGQTSQNMNRDAQQGKGIRTQVSTKYLLK